MPAISPASSLSSPFFCFPLKPPFHCSMDQPQNPHQKQPQFPPPPPTPSSTSFPVLAFSICGILITSILLLSYYIFVVKCCFNSRRSDVVSRLSRSWMRSENSLMVFPTTIQSRGLDESAIRSIPTFRYRRAGEGDEQGRSSCHECAVCLNEFQDEERIRLLPNCLHVFHIDCIDTWLQTNANCPLCRSDITTTSPIPDDHLMDSASSHQNLQHSGDVVIEINNDGGDEVQAVGSSINTDDPSPMEAEQGVGYKKGRKLHHVSSMGDECMDARGKDVQFSIQPIRRSFSMGSSSDRQLYMTVQKILQQNPHFQDVSTEESSSNSSSSNSGRIRRSFFSFGPCRISRSAVLPIRNEV